MSGGLRTLFALADGRAFAAMAAGGFVGALGRATLVDHYPAAAGAWPWSTFVANVVGAALLGYFVTRLDERLPLSAYRRPALGTGLCGGLTTFSGLQLEVLQMLDAHRYGLALAYVLASVLAGFTAVMVATHVTRRTRVFA